MSIHNDPQDYYDLKLAVKLLEAPSITARISNIIGSPIEGAVKRLPASVSNKVNGVVEAALHKSVSIALSSLSNTPNKQASNKLHKFYAASSGALGGAFGFTALFIELPITTTLMMRSVADIARSEGFDLEDLATKLACIEVFAMGGKTKSDDATETGYYLTRGFTTETMRHLSKELVEIATKQGAHVVGTSFTPSQAGKWLAALIEKVAKQFGVVITNKFAAQAVPILGAATGATINTLFIDFYQEMARGHFIIMRLENKYGYEEIRSAYVGLLKRR